MKFILFLILTFSTSISYAQVGKDNPELWNLMPKTETHNSLVRIETPEGFGTGVVVKITGPHPSGVGSLGFVATAHHVVDCKSDCGKIKIRFSNGKKAKNCKLKHFDKENDAALILAWIPEGIKPVLLSDSPAKKDDILEFTGLGGGSRLSNPRVFLAIASLSTNKNKLYADACLIEGDSGGPIFNNNGELLGLVSGGWFWLDFRIQNTEGNPVSLTWPARGCNVEVIKELLNKYKTIPTEDEITITIPQYQLKQGVLK